MGAGALIVILLGLRGLRMRVLVAFMRFLTRLQGHALRGVHGQRALERHRDR
jgi:hypothetical protein